MYFCVIEKIIFSKYLKLTLKRLAKENCPYRHVKVNEDADVCEDFLKGYCPLNDKV